MASMTISAWFLGTSTKVYLSYMAYVGSYSYTGKAKGITVYDVDVEKGKFIYRCEVEVDNSSYLTVSRDKKMLYSIADEGVVSFRILQNGSLSRVNSANIKGMRGCQISKAPKTTTFSCPASYGCSSREDGNSVLPRSPAPYGIRRR